jgi:p-cumate 2,3-dioxygenase subunit beta
MQQNRRPGWRNVSTSVPTEPVPLASVQAAALAYEVEQFLYAEAELLDEWRLHEWLELFTPDAYYLVPTTDLPNGDPDTDLFLVRDDRFLLEQRVNSLLTRSAHAEYPHSRTSRIVGNVRAQVTPDTSIAVSANFSISRLRNGSFDSYVGRYRHVLERAEDGFRFRVRKSILALETLRPQGKISILL